MATKNVFDNMFESLINKGYVTKEIALDNLKLTMKVLDTAEILQADAVFTESSGNIPEDVLHRLRVVSNLSYAIMSINDVTVPKDAKEAYEMRHQIREILMKLPPTVIEYLAKQYRTMVDEQDKIYENLGEHIENF